MMEWLTVVEAAAALKVSVWQMYRLLPRIEHSRAPGVGIRICPKSLDRFLKLHRPGRSGTSTTGPSPGKKPRKPRCVKRTHGTRAACDRDEVFPGMTREELKNQAGI